MRKFTATQAKADEIDRDLFSAMCNAEYMSERTDLPTKERIAWRNAFLQIQSARPQVRLLMHPETRDETY